MMAVSANRFFSAWSETAGDCGEDLVKNWHLLDTYTSIVLDDPECILKKVGDKLELKCYSGGSGYYCTDGILYRPEDLVPGTKNGTYWFRGIQVAFEHEHVY